MVNITLRCVLSSAGEPHPNTADVDGATLVDAREDKERTYPGLTTSGRCRLPLKLAAGGRFRETIGVRQSPRGALLHAVLHSTLFRNDAGRGCSSLSFAASLVEPSDTCETWCWTGGHPLCGLVGAISAFAAARASLGPISLFPADRSHSSFAPDARGSSNHDSAPPHSPSLLCTTSQQPPLLARLRLRKQAHELPRLF